MALKDSHLAEFQEEVMRNLRESSRLMMDYAAAANNPVSVELAHIVMNEIREKYENLHSDVLTLIYTSGIAKRPDQ